MADYYIVSARNRSRIPAQGCLVELEDVLVDCCGGSLVTPGTAGGPALPILRRVSKPLLIRIPKRSQDQQILIIVALSLAFVVEVLASISHWRSRFDLVCAYVWDGWMPETEYRKSKWRRRLSRFSSTIASLDHLFIPMSGSVRAFREFFGVPVSMIPMACDVVRFGSSQATRCIEVIGYGRQHASHSRTLAGHYNTPHSRGLYYHTDHMRIEEIHDFYAHRRMFWKILHQSRIALAYDPFQVNSFGRFPFSFVGQRWFECITAGCLIVGRRPTCPEMDELFSWDDSTIEVPEEDDELIPFLEELLADEDRLASAHSRNYRHALGSHDWRYRIADMHDRLGVPYPEPLRRQLELITRQHEEARNSVQ